jgi:hypothetical protein
MFFYVVRRRSQNSLETSALARIGPVGSQKPDLSRRRPIQRIRGLSLSPASDSLRFRQQLAR